MSTSSVSIRPYGARDFEALLALQQACFPPPYPDALLWTRAQVAAHESVFPEGALCVVSAGGALVASCTSLLLKSEEYDERLTWREVSGNGTLSTHRPGGDILYGIDMAVHPDWRGLGLARLLYESRYLFVVKNELAAFQAASRMPGYGAVRLQLSPEAYVDEVVKGRRTDSVLTPQLRSGLVPVRVLPNHLDDEQSGHTALLLEWRNALRVRRVAP